MMMLQKKWSPTHNCLLENKKNNKGRLLLRTKIDTKNYDYEQFLSFGAKCARNYYNKVQEKGRRRRILANLGKFRMLYNLRQLRCGSHTDIVSFVFLAFSSSAEEFRSWGSSRQRIRSEQSHRVSQSILVLLTRICDGMVIVSSHVPSSFIPTEEEGGGGELSFHCIVAECNSLFL